MYLCVCVHLCMCVSLDEGVQTTPFEVWACACVCACLGLGTAALPLRWQPGNPIPHINLTCHSCIIHITHTLLSSAVLAFIAQLGKQTKSGLLVRVARVYLFILILVFEIENIGRLFFEGNTAFAMLWYSAHI